MSNPTIGSDKTLSRLDESSDLLCGTSYRIDYSLFFLDSIPNFFNPISFGVTASKNHAQVGISFKHMLYHVSRSLNGKRSFRN